MSPRRAANDKPMFTVVAKLDLVAMFRMIAKRGSR
jgi:hypothetical protein